MEMIVLRADDQDAILDFENQRLEADETLDFMEKQMSSWNARWRKEALEHYLPLGWSFAVWSDQKKSDLLGYVLCQPLLFFRGMTQTLWVEHLAASNEKVEKQLGEIVYRWSRDKHLQQLVVPRAYESAVSDYKREFLDNELLSINTSKLRS